jgi:hypothetical protein
MGGDSHVCKLLERTGRLHFHGSVCWGLRLALCGVQLLMPGRFVGPFLEESNV